MRWLRISPAWVTQALSMMSSAKSRFKLPSLLTKSCSSICRFLAYIWLALVATVAGRLTAPTIFTPLTMISRPGWV